MIISAAPFRVSFAGGGSDLAVYYRRRRGAVLSATINKHCYLSVHPYFNRGQTLLKYSQAELLDDVREARHPILREALLDLWPKGGLEIVSTADIPSGTGLGSSSTFTVALAQALYACRGTFCSKERLARKACEIEIERLGEPIGKQDQYAAAYGGLNFIEFHPNETVLVTPLMLPAETITQLESNTLLFYTGGQRQARDILREQSRHIAGDALHFDNLTRLVDLAYRMRDLLAAGDLRGFARALHEGWMLKRSLGAYVSTPHADQCYERALECGALGGKLLGAGGAGFLLLYCEPEHQERVRQALFDLCELPVRFDWGGARIIYVGEGHTEEGFFASNAKDPGRTPKQ